MGILDRSINVLRFYVPCSDRCNYLSSIVNSGYALPVAKLCLAYKHWVLPLVSGVVIAVFIAAVTVCVQATKALLVNPVKKFKE